MSTNRRRLWIISKDVEIIMERSPRQARRLLEKIRRKFKKEPYQPVSIAEFCQYMGLDIEATYRGLNM